MANSNSEKCRVESSLKQLLVSCCRQSLTVLKRRNLEEYKLNHEQQCSSYRNFESFSPYGRNNISLINCAGEVCTYMRTSLIHQCVGKVRKTSIKIWLYLGVWDTWSVMYLSSLHLLIIQVHSSLLKQ